MYELTSIGLSVGSLVSSAFLPGHSILVWASRCLLVLTGLGFGVYVLAAVAVACLGTIARGKVGRPQSLPS